MGWRLGANRWVEPKHPFKYDASTIPAEWHRWMHNITDFPPQTVRVCAQQPAGLLTAGGLCAQDPHMEYRPSFATPFEPNRTGTPLEYVPYSTARQNKVQAWDPNAAK